LLDLRVCLDWALGRGWAFVEDDTMDRAEPAVDRGGQRALPAPEPQPRPRGRHEASRQGPVGGPAGAAIAVVVASVAFAGLLAIWLISSAREGPGPATTGRAATTAPGGPPTRPPGPSAFGNLVINWSFEENLDGWQVLGQADSSREPQGRTSGSCASLRARGPEPGQVGLALPEVAPSVTKGQRYVASAWVRSTAPGQRVTVRLVGGGKEASRATATTLPGLEWRRVIVAHTVAAAGPLRLEIVADGVPAGEALLVDEVIVRRG
jgi:Carbohydrate binding domain